MSQGNNAITKAGFLYKRGALNYAWRRRWCVLKDSTLYYYKSESNDAHLGDIKLEQAVVRQAVDETKQFVFEIVTKTRAYVLAADSSVDMQKWIACLALQTKLHFENAQIETAERLLSTAMSYFRRDFLVDEPPPVTQKQRQKQRQNQYFSQKKPSLNVPTQAKTGNQNQPTATNAGSTKHTSIQESPNQPDHKQRVVDDNVDVSTPTRLSDLINNNSNNSLDDNNNNNNASNNNNNNIEDDDDDGDDDDDSSHSDHDRAAALQLTSPATKRPDNKLLIDEATIVQEATPSVQTTKLWAVEAIHAGNFVEGKKLLTEVLVNHPKDAVALYNLACVESLLQNKNESFRYLELALKHGYNNLEKLLHDQDLNNVRTLDRFWPMVKEYQSNLHLFDLMRQPNTGVQVQTRKWLLKTYPNCFVGSEAVTWLVKNQLSPSRENGVSVGRQLLKHGLIRHVTDDHDFEDAYLFYTFSDQEGPPTNVNDDATFVDDDEIVLKVI